MATTIVKSICMKLAIPKISDLKEIWSPAMPIHGIEWKVKFRKMGQGKNQSLAAFLYCFNDDKTAIWSLWGDLSLKLLPFSDDGIQENYQIQPCAFGAFNRGWGCNLIKWNELIKKDNKYVKDDTINLEIEVKAENPNDPNRSRLNFECIHKCCGDCQLATFRLTVANVLNLMAVKSPPFTFYGYPWNIQTSKTRSSHLGVSLRLNRDADDEMSITMTIKLVSAKKDVQAIGKCFTQRCEYLGSDKFHHVITWDELIKPENGFVNDGSITLEIELKPDPNAAPSAKRVKLNPEIEVKSPQMECPICFKRIANQELAVTTCGHMFCFECIKKELTRRAVCPSCNKAIQLDALKQVYLPTIN